MDCFSHAPIFLIRQFEGAGVGELKVFPRTSAGQDATTLEEANVPYTEIDCSFTGMGARSRSRVLADPQKVIERNDREFPCCLVFDRFRTRSGEQRIRYRDRDC